MGSSSSSKSGTKQDNKISQKQYTLDKSSDIFNMNQTYTNQAQINNSQNIQLLGQYIGSQNTTTLSDRTILNNTSTVHQNLSTSAQRSDIMFEGDQNVITSRFAPTAFGTLTSTTGNQIAGSIGDSLGGSTSGSSSSNLGGVMGGNTLSTQGTGNLGGYNITADKTTGVASFGANQNPTATSNAYSGPSPASGIMSNLSQYIWPILGVVGVIVVIIIIMQLL